MLQLIEWSNYSSQILIILGIYRSYICKAFTFLYHWLNLLQGIINLSILVFQIVNNELL